MEAQASLEWTNSTVELQRTTIVGTEAIGAFIYSNNCSEWDVQISVALSNAPAEHS
jgi:hypothetical protein